MVAVRPITPKKYSVFSKYIPDRVQRTLIDSRDPLRPSRSTLRESPTASQTHEDSHQADADLPHILCARHHLSELAHEEDDQLRFASHRSGQKLRRSRESATDRDLRLKHQSCLGERLESVHESRLFEIDGEIAVPEIAVSKSKKQVGCMETL